MLGRLIKHEFRVTSRIIPLFYLAVLAAAVSTAISDEMRLKTPSLISASLLMCAGMLVMFGTAAYLVIRFYKGVYGPEGYLTMTLPVSERHILLSRGIVASAWTLLGCVCMTLAFYYSFCVMIKYTQDTAKDAAEAIGMFSGGFMWFVLIASLIGGLAFLAETYMCVTVAHVGPFRKLGLGAAVLCYIIIYFAEQIAALPLILFAPISIEYTQNTGWQITNKSTFASINEIFARTASDNPPNIGIASLFLSIAMLIICSAITLRLMKRKINIR